MAQLFDNKYPYTDFHELNLDWILEHISDFYHQVDELFEWKETHEKEYKELKDFYDAVLSGDFPDSIVTAFREWMEKNAVDLIGLMVKFVFFGLTDSGYFVAYIPENWREIEFSTTNYDEVAPDYEYGHLILSY